MEKFDNLKTGCYEFAVKEIDGIVIEKDILFGRDGKIFSVTVGTEESVAAIQEANNGVPEDVRLSENIYVMNDLSDPKKICEELRTNIPFETLQPFVTEQDLTEQE